MITITEWLTDLSENYSVQHCDDVNSGTFVAKVKGDIYLMRNAKVKEKGY